SWGAARAAFVLSVKRRGGVTVVGAAAAAGSRCARGPAQRQGGVEHVGVAPVAVVPVVVARSADAVADLLIRVAVARLVLCVTAFVAPVILAVSRQIH